MRRRDCKVTDVEWRLNIAVIQSKVKNVIFISLLFCMLLIVIHNEIHFAFATLTNSLLIYMCQLLKAVTSVDHCCLSGAPS